MRHFSALTEIKHVSSVALSPAAVQGDAEALLTVPPALPSTNYITPGMTEAANSP